MFDHTRFSARLALTGLLSISLISCGGSGGDGGNDNNDSDTDTATRSGSVFNEENGIEMANSIAAPLSAFVSSFLAIDNEDEDNVYDAVKNRSSMLRANESFTVDCDSGSMTIEMELDDATQSLSKTVTTYNDCAFDNESTMNGSLTMVATDGDLSSDNVSVAISFDNLNMTSETDTANLHGSLDMVTFSDETTSYLQVSGSDLTMTENGEIVRFSNFDFSAMSDDIEESFSIGGSGVVGHGDDSIETIIDPPLTGATDTGIETGMVTMNADDGSYLIIDADTGNPDTFSYTIFDGSTTSTGERNWTDTDLSM